MLRLYEIFSLKAAAYIYVYVYVYIYIIYSCGYAKCLL